MKLYQSQSDFTPFLSGSKLFIVSTAELSKEMGRSSVTTSQNLRETPAFLPFSCQSAGKFVINETVERSGKSYPDQSKTNSTVLL